jgi:hypothetical protein
LVFICSHLLFDKMSSKKRSRFHGQVYSVLLERANKMKKQAVFVHDAVPTQADLDGLHNAVIAAAAADAPALTLNGFIQRNKAKWKMMHMIVSGHFFNIAPSARPKEQVSVRVHRLLVWLVAVVELVHWSSYLSITRRPGDCLLRDLVAREQLSMQLASRDKNDDAARDRFQPLVTADIQSNSEQIDAENMRRLECIYLLPLVDDVDADDEADDEHVNVEWSQKQLAGVAKLYKNPGSLLCKIIIKYKKLVFSANKLLFIVINLMDIISKDAAHLRDAMTALREMVELPHQSEGSDEPADAHWGTCERKMAAQMLLSLEIASLTQRHFEASDWEDAQARWAIFLHDAGSLKMHCTKVCRRNREEQVILSDDGGHHLLCQVTM